MQLSPEALRVLENLSMAYDTWLDCQRHLLGFDYWLMWKKSGGFEYLYKMHDRRGNGQSLGVRSAETERQYEAYRQNKDPAQNRCKHLKARLDELWPLYRALRLPLLAAEAGAVLREADRRSVLGRLRVIGTNALLAYELEAQHRFATGLDATEDFDLCWASEKTALLTTDTPMLDVLREADDSYLVNQERPFQARNQRGYEVELLIAPSQTGHYSAADPIRPLALPEQEWLLPGRSLSHVVFDRKGLACRLVVPDPRWFALHKAWLAEKPERNRLKVGKDAQQALVLWRAIQHTMPHYPIDAAFIAALPPALHPALQRLQNGG